MFARRLFLPIIKNCLADESNETVVEMLDLRQVTHFGSPEGLRTTTPPLWKKRIMVINFDGCCTKQKGSRFSVRVEMNEIRYFGKFQWPFGDRRNQTFPGWLHGMQTPQLFWKLIFWGQLKSSRAVLNNECPKRWDSGMNVTVHGLSHAPSTFQIHR